MDRSLARDAAFDGRFLTGVVTTGIYCIASCPARKPNPSNIRFFRTEAEARQAGLRACRRCRPDDYFRKYDPDADLMESLVAEVDKGPAAFSSVADLVGRSGVGTSKLHELFRAHYHTTPAMFLRDHRIEHASKQLLHTRRSLLDVAAAAGFESPSAFHANFNRHQRLTPAEYRALGRRSTFALKLPSSYRADLTIQSFGRDPSSVSERLTGRVMEKAVMVGGTPALLQIELGQKEARCSIISSPRLSADAMALAHRMILRVLGLRSDPGPFESMLRKAGMGALMGDRSGLRVTHTATVYESLLWAIVGQQVNLSFAFKMRRAVLERWGTPIEGLYAHPDPARIAGIDYSQLLKLQFSRSKAEYLIDVSRKIAAGDLQVERFPSMRAPAVRDLLLGIRGVGVWSANYVMMRGCGFGDCVPAGDTGLGSGLQKFFELKNRPSPAETATLMCTFAPYRSLATFHLWMFNRAAES